MRRRVVARSTAASEYQDWLPLVDISGPFLALPVLARIWPTLESVDPSTREMLRVAHADGQVDPDLWTDFVLRRLLGWGDALQYEGMADLQVPVPEYGTSVEPSFALTDPETGAPRLLGLTLKPGNHPSVRQREEAWPATPTDRLAMLCRYHRVELGLVTDGRWFGLVAVPPGGVTTTAVFDTATWAESAERIVVRAFVSLLERRRFFGVPENETLPALLLESLDRQEEITEALGDQVRQAVELLVAAIGRDDLRKQQLRGTGLAEVATAHDVYHAAVTVAMRIVFLLFAEERGLLPADNALYASAYSVGQLCDDLERRAQESSEEDLEYSRSAWLRLLALCNAIHHGTGHPRLGMPTYDGPMFDPRTHSWLSDVAVDDRTMLHMLLSVQYVTLKKERRRLSFRALDVEQIGYVYEGLLAFDGYRADQTIVGLIATGADGDEVPLAELESHAAQVADIAALADRLAEAYRDSKIGTAKALTKRLKPPDPSGRAEALRLLLAATDGDRGLAERLLPFTGLLRRDLRDLPVVIHAGSLYVTKSLARASTGALYTPRALAEEVVDQTLEALVYQPGPLQTNDRLAWRPRSSTELLELKVADIAVGSGAFLVAACRYLARFLVEAWSAEGGDPEARALIDAGVATGLPADVEADAVTIKARREIIQRCLYGIDINPMAVEIAKLSLWLISMDPEQPFTFLDDRLAVGDSLLGISTVEQLEDLHLNPTKGRVLGERWLGDPTAGLRELVVSVAEKRRHLAEMSGDTIVAVEAKQCLHAGIQAETATARLYANLVVGAALKNAGRPERELNTDLVGVADLVRRITLDVPGAEDEAWMLAQRWLSVDLPPGAAARRPLHLPLVFSEVVERGGFDAVVGNQPYLGGKKLTGVLGVAYREHLVKWLGGDTRGNADLVTYFVLRSHEWLSSSGVTGLIATNTLAQGDTREVGLSRIVNNGVTIWRAVKSRPWPSRSATLEVCIIRTSRALLADGVLCDLDGVNVRGVTDSLDPVSRITGKALRLVENRSIAFIGNLVNGIGFAMSDHAAVELIAQDPRNAKVLRRYLNGQDLNSRPKCDASRWIIDFGDWSLPEAQRYPDCLDRVRRLVKPARDALPDSKRAVREAWWRYEKLAPGLRKAIAGLERVIVITLVSKVVMPVMVPTDQVFSHMLGVFATDDPAMLALLSSAPHYWWTMERASTLETRVRYTPSDVFEAFARPQVTGQMRVLGERLDMHRQDLMLARQSGLTATYNLVHDPACKDDDLIALRNIHTAIDEAVARAYGWYDLPLDHGFHETRQGIRYTVGPVVRQEILDRLLELNHDRYALEQERAAATQGELFG